MHHATAQHEAARALPRTAATYDTLPEQLDWIRARFAGKAFEPNCAGTR